MDEPLNHDVTRAPLSRRRPSVRRRRLFRGRIGKFRQSISPDQFEALSCVITMDLLHIEFAHEVDRLLRDHLPWNHDREAWRIGDDEIG